MRIFLASQASHVLHLLTPYLNNDPQDMKCIVISTASNLYPDHPWLDEDLSKLRELGFNPQIIDISTYSQDDLEKECKDVDLIFVAGGNTSYLLEQSILSGFDTIIQSLRSKDMWYVGSSAGSVIAGPNIEYDKLYDEGEFGKTLESYAGFDLVDFIIVPHANSPLHRPYIDKSLNMYGDKWKMIELTDDQAILIDGEKTEHLSLNQP